MKPIGKYVNILSYLGSATQLIYETRAQGKGIFLFTKLSQISDWKSDNRSNPEQQVESYVVQKYISNPYLVGGKKVSCKISII
jgi:hypothetical protein